MEYTNTEVALTIQIRGAQATRGNYGYKQTGSSWKKVGEHMEKTPVGRLEVKSAPVEHACFKSTTLNKDFVNWAISNDARPDKRQMSARFWMNLSKKNRLEYQIKQYVEATHGDVEFSFEIVN